MSSTEQFGLFEGEHARSARAIADLLDALDSEHQFEWELSLIHI